MIKRTFEELKLAGQLPSSPGVGTRILTLTQGDGTSLEDIGRCVAADPALAGRLLGLANGPRAAGAGKVTSVDKAIARLGADAVKEAIQSMPLVSANRSGTCRNFDYGRFWSLSLARAIAAQGLSARIGVGTPEDAYTLGLLASIGYLALASVYPSEYSDLLSACGEGHPVKLARAERERLEIDHFEVGAYLLEAWGLPESFAHAVQMYELRERSWHSEDAEVRGWTKLLGGAQLLAEMCVAGGESASTSWHIAERLERMSRSVGLSPESIRALCRLVVRQWCERAEPVKILTWSEGQIPIENDAASRKPAAGRREGKKGKAREVVEPAGRVGLRILAVDDDPTSLKMLEVVLAKQGHAVTCAVDGSEALRIALENNPQVVVADWMMPRMDGLELCKALRRIQSGRDIFFLLLTGRGEEDRVVEAFDAGVDDYVTKPFNPRILMARIKGGQRVIELKERVESDRQLILKQVGELGIYSRKLQTAAMTDALTEMPNRRYVRRHLEEQWDVATRTGKPLSVIMLDIDHFKRVNDVYGHDAGDLVLRETADVLRANTRYGEDAARLGGEEFLVVCGNTTAEQAAVGAERLRKALEKHEIKSASFKDHVTVSLGVAQRTPEMSGIDALLKAADDAVYAAKDGGRNRVCVAGREERKSKSA